MELNITVPNRIDLAGGTTDIHPLYLLMDGGCTVNAAVTVQSRVSIRSRPGPGIVIISSDLGQTVEAQSAEALPVGGPLGLLGRAVKAFPPAGGVEIITHNEAPAGSGLGASSALLVALLAGLFRMRGEDLSPATLVDYAANLETATIGVPTGKQDHVGALFGGVSCIDFGYRGFTRTEVCRDAESRKRLQDMVVLTYTGLGRFSGMNNWDITRDFIAGRAEIREKLLRIREVAKRLAAALTAQRWRDLASLVDQEWILRRELAPGVSNPRIDQIMAAAKGAGASASKICGAGGGGCMITIVTPQKRGSVELAITNAGGTVIPFEIDGVGLSISRRKAKPSR